MNTFKPVSEWRTYAVDRFGEHSPAVRWLDKLSKKNREGPGQLLEGPDSNIIHVLEQLEAREMDV